MLASLAFVTYRIICYYSGPFTLPTPPRLPRAMVLGLKVKMNDRPQSPGIVSTFICRDLQLRSVIADGDSTRWRAVIFEPNRNALALTE